MDLIQHPGNRVENSCINYIAVNTLRYKIFASNKCDVSEFYSIGASYRVMILMEHMR